MHQINTIVKQVQVPQIVKHVEVPRAEKVVEVPLSNRWSNPRGSRHYRPR